MGTAILLVVSFVAYHVLHEVVMYLERNRYTDVTPVEFPLYDERKESSLITDP